MRPVYAQTLSNLHGSSFICFKLTNWFWSDTFDALEKDLVFGCNYYGNKQILRYEYFNSQLKCSL